MSSMTECLLYVTLENYAYTEPFGKLLKEVIKTFEEGYLFCYEEEGVIRMTVPFGTDDTPGRCVKAMDYLFRKNDISDICFELRGDVDMDYGEHYEIKIEYKNGVAISQTSYNDEDVPGRERHFEPKVIDNSFLSPNARPCDMEKIEALNESFDFSIFRIN